MHNFSGHVDVQSCQINSIMQALISNTDELERKGESVSQ